MTAMGDYRWVGPDVVICRLSGGASELLLGVKTIETYRSRLPQKLCLQSDADICRFAYDHKLIKVLA